MFYLILLEDQVECFEFVKLHFQNFISLYFFILPCNSIDYIIFFEEVMEKKSIDVNYLIFYITLKFFLFAVHYLTSIKYKF